MPNAQLHTKKLDVQLRDMLPSCCADAQCLLPGKETMRPSLPYVLGVGKVCAQQTKCMTVTYHDMQFHKLQSAMENGN